MTDVAEIAARGDWLLRAACRAEPADWWDLVGNKLSATNRAAARICWDVCPVRYECEQYGREHRSVGVIMGGIAFHEGPQTPRSTVTVTCEVCGALVVTVTRKRRFCSGVCAATRRVNARPRP